MSIRLRFTLTLTLLGLILFVGYAVFAYHSEKDDLRVSLEGEVRALGRSLEISLGNALRDRQREDVDETLRTLESLAPTLEIHVADADGHTIARSDGAASDAAVRALMRKAAETKSELLEYRPAEDQNRAVYAAPLTADDGTLLGSVALVRPLTDQNADLARTRGRLIFVVVAFVAVTSAAGLLLGTYYVTRPIATVLAGIRHVRDGDFRSRVPAARPHEIGSLFDESNAMAAAIGEANARVEQATEARIRMERGLQRVDKMVTIGQLSAGLAHEIGSPLQVLTGRASALLARSTDPESRRQAQILVDQSERIARIVEQLLSFGRRRAPVVAPCDLAAPVQAVLELLAGEALRRGVALRFEAGPGDHRIDADADQIQQVVLNLVKNALTATPAGGTITVRVETDAPADGDRVRLIVKDSGGGIPPEMLPRLFEPFFTTHAAEGGTGLGLAVVRAIAIEHGGEVAARSAPGEGAAFVVSFPRRDAGRRNEHA